MDNPEVSENQPVSGYPRPEPLATVVDGPPPPGSPKIGFIQQLSLSAYWFGSNFVWGALLAVVIAHEMEVLAPLTKAKHLGLLYTVGALPALLIPLLVGALSDRCTSTWGRRRPYILFGGVIAIIGLLAMWGAFEQRSLTLYFAAYFVLQFGSNTALAAYSGVIPDLVPADQRGTASGYMAFMSQFATLLGALLGGFIKGANVTYGLLITVFSLFLVWSLVGIRETPMKSAEPIHWKEYLQGLVEPLKHRDFLWVWITRALMMLGFYAIQPYILYFLKDMIGVKDPGKEAGVVIGIILIGATVSGILGGALSDKIGRKPIVYAASGIISTMAVGFIFCHSMLEVLLVGILFGLGYGAYISVDWALGTDVLPSKEDSGNDMAVWHVSMTLPQQISPLVAGFLLSQFTTAESSGEVVSYARNGYAIVFVLAAICFALSAVLLRNVKGAR